LVIGFADVAQLKQPAVKRPGQRLAVTLAVAQLFQSRRHGCKVVGITGLEFQQELSHRRPASSCFVELYSEFHDSTTSKMMLSGFLNLTVRRISGRYRLPPSLKLPTSFRVAELRWTGWWTGPSSLHFDATRKTSTFVLRAALWWTRKLEKQNSRIFP